MAELDALSLSGLTLSGRAMVLVIAIGLDAYLGGIGLDRRVRWHPVALFGRFAAWFDDKLNRTHRPAGDRRFRGAMALLLLLAGALFLGIALDSLARDRVLVWTLVLLLVTAMVDLAGPRRRAKALAKAMASDGVTGARAILPTLSDRDPDLADRHEIARIALESATAMAARRGYGAVIAFLMLGLPGLLGYRVLSETVLRWTPPGRPPGPFSGPARALWHPVNMAVQAVTGAWLALTALLTRRRGAGGLRALWQHRRAPGDWPRAALAGALGFALGGPRRYATRVVPGAWVGTGKAKLDQADILVALKLHNQAMVLMVAGLAALAVLPYL